MRVAFLADAASIHSQRWILGLKSRGIAVEVWSERPWMGHADDVVVHDVGYSRLGFFSRIKRLKQEVQAYRPDLVHAHYVSRYGLYAALINAHPLVLSIWGADVEVFPKGKAGLNAEVLRWILSHAEEMTASSEYLRQVTGQYAKNKGVAVIPFGIDRSLFYPRPRGEGPLKWIINKALEPVYGIDKVLPVLASLRDAGPFLGKILGTGSMHAQLTSQVQQLGLERVIEFSGRVSPSDLPEMLSWADVGLYPSLRESFGVAPLEMAALGRASFAHDLGGLREVILPGQTGYLIKTLDTNAWRDRIAWAIKNPEAVREMGQNGPGWVARRYDFDKNLDTMIDLYAAVAQRAQKRGG